MNCKDFIHDVVTHLSGEAPAIDVVEDEHGAVITISIKGATSPVIGKHGATIDAIRTIVKAIGYNGKHRIKVVIDESAS